MRIPLLLALLLISLTASAQQLPHLYEKKDFDSIGYYIQLRWKEPVEPDLLCQAILLSIQRNIFNLTDFSDLDALTQPLINQLNAYANLLAACRDTKCNMPEPEKKIVATTSLWANDLLRTRSLDSIETFLCRVYSGDIRHPDAYLSTHTVAPIAGGASDPNDFAPRVNAVLTIGSGIWLPNGHLSLLGVHPQINFGFGVRNTHNEWDMDGDIRFVNTPSPYTILRNDTLRYRTYYDGGNLSFNYTRYLLKHGRSEAGLSAGMGADFIDFASDSQTAGFSPTEIASFDFNLGLRYNYRIGKQGFLGLVARYHFLSYTNPGGSPFDGNAATINIIIGATGEYRH